MSKNIEAANYPSGDDYTDDINELFSNEEQLDVDDRVDTDSHLDMPLNTGEAPRTAAQGSEKGGKKKMSKNQLALYLVLGVVILFALLLFLQMPSSEPSGPVKKSTGFQVTSEPQSPAAVRTEVVLELEQQIRDLKNELKDTKEAVDEAFESIAVTLNNQQKTNTTLVEELKTIKSSYDDLLSNGNNKFVDQSKKLNSIQTDFNAKLLSLKKDLESFKEEQNNKLDISKRKQYEVVSVVTGKALIRDISSGNELRIEVGTELSGFGVISDINITGCITFETGERYTPIKGRCM
ncbi:hypothetical protein GCM10011607_28450 [Shewanella inventionis]|uniref:Uncharacterized protein n=1 Tax=Shewanella inventionis TaxID=1738770 RepID=A0ABQ1JGU2_9GAMM|nr:hypothetical protein [Shewanella inventionis]GGB66057.1 hypothetical protein GCM10011607_28450 [Shewanella inventionis]